MPEVILLKKWFIQTALSYLGTPYIWGGDDPSGFDCSGFVVECLKSIGFIGENEDYTANRLFQKYKSNQIKSPRKGALIFRLNQDSHAEHAEHVAICLDHQFKIEAIGGAEGTSSPVISWLNNAFVKIRPINFNKNKYKIIYLFKD